MPHPPREKRGRLAVILIAGLVLLPALYVLSIGPVLRMSKEYFREDLLDTEAYPTYRPLLFAAQSSETAERFLYWYLELWLDRQPLTVKQWLDKPRPPRFQGHGGRQRRDR